MTAFLKKISFLQWLMAAIVLASSCHSEKKLARHHRYIQDTYASLKKALGDADVSILKDTIKVLFPNDVMFDYNEAVIKPAAQPDFKKFAGVLQTFTKTHLLINGHTDSVGGDVQSNMVLSQRRADSAKNVLVFCGIDGQRIQTWGLGTKDPIASNSTEEGRARNRRVEFIVLDDYKK